MKFSISSQELKKQLESIDQALDPKGRYPILECFLFELQDRKLTITASDLEVYMQTSLVVDQARQGSIALPGKIVIETLHLLPNQPITFDVNTDTGKVKISCSLGSYKIMGQPPLDFPRFPKLDSPIEKITLNSSLMREGIEKTFFATLKNDDLRPALTGIFLEFNASSKTLSFTSTDACKLAHYVSEPIEKIKAKKIKFILSNKCLQLLKKNITDTELGLKFAFTDSQAFFGFPTKTLVCRLLDEKYPNYKAIIPKGDSHTLSTARSQLLESIKRILPYTSPHSNKLKLKIKGTQLLVKATDDHTQNKATETLSCKYGGQDMSIAFNAKMLISILSNINSHTIDFNFYDSSKAVVIKENFQEKGDFFMLAMPLST